MDHDALGPAATPTCDQPHPANMMNRRDNINAASSDAPAAAASPAAVVDAPSLSDRMDRTPRRRRLCRESSGESTSDEADLRDADVEEDQRAGDRRSAESDDSHTRRRRRGRKHRRHSSPPTAASAVASTSHAPQQEDDGDEMMTHAESSEATTLLATASAAATARSAGGSSSVQVTHRPSSAGAATSIHSTGASYPTHAAASTSHRRTAGVTSIIARCDNNSLSLILAFLNAKDFHSSMKVNRQWRSVSQVNTAWPKFDLQRFVRQLQADDYDNPLHRRLHVHVKHLPRLLRSPTYQKCSDVHLKANGSSHPSALEQLSQLHHLTAVNLTLSIRADETLRAFAMQVRDRLQSLVLACTTSRKALGFSSFGLLHRLRILVINFLPPLNELARLHQLEYLHIDHGQCLSPDLMRVIRYLSVRHHLRTVSLDCKENLDGSDHVEGLAVDTLAQSSWSEIRTESQLQDRMEAEDEIMGDPDDWFSPYAARLLDPLADVASLVDLPSSALIDFSLSGRWLTNDQLESLCHLPSLQRLQCDVYVNRRFGVSSNDRSTVEWSDTIQQCFHQLTHLKLCIRSYHSKVDLRGFGRCRALQTLCLKVDSDTSGSGSLDLTTWLPSLTRLEDLTLGGLVMPRTWPSLSYLVRLRRLDLALGKTPNLDHFASILAQLPSFETLELTLRSRDRPLVLTADFVTAVTQSATWRSLCLHIGVNLYDPPYQADAAWSIDLSNRRMNAATIDATTAKRFRVFRHARSSVDIFHIGVDAAGRPAWMPVQDESNMSI
jgi:hypothetical protein